MPLFKTVAQLGLYIPISATIKDANLPMQDAAEQKYIIPVLGSALFATLQAEADANTTPGTLLKKTRQALAFFVYYENAPYMHTIISESGFKAVTNTNIQGAYKYQYYDILQHMMEDGCFFLEQLFNYLLENKVTYSTWTSSTAYTRLNKNLIKTGSQFAQIYHLYQPNRTFNALQPIVQEVEDMFVIPSIGREFFEYLRDAASPSTAEKDVIELLQRAIVNLTIHKCINKLSITIKPEGLTVMQLATNDNPNPGEANAPAEEKNKLRDETGRDGNAYLLRAVEYLNAYASNSVFPLFFASSLYVDPTVEVTNINEDLGGVFVL